LRVHTIPTYIESTDSMILC